MLSNDEIRKDVDVDDAKLAARTRRLFLVKIGHCDPATTDR